MDEEPRKLPSGLVAKLRRLERDAKVFLSGAVFYVCATFLPWAEDALGRPLSGWAFSLPSVLGHLVVVLAVGAALLHAHGLVRLSRKEGLLPRRGAPPRG